MTEMKPTSVDAFLVGRVANLIETSRLGKATVTYLWDRLNLAESEYSHLVSILKKYFKKDGWSRQDYSHYYVPRADLKLPETDPTNPPEYPREEMKPVFCPGTHASRIFDALEREEDRLDKEREKEKSK